MHSAHSPAPEQPDASPPNPQTIKAALDVLLRVYGIAPPIAVTITSGEQMRVDELAGRFLEWHASRVSRTRLRQSRFYLRDFVSCLGHLTIAEMRRGGCAMVDAWVCSHRGWNGCRGSVICRVKQLFKWGSDQGFYSGSPVALLDRPGNNTRVAYFSPEQVDAILRHGSENFRQAFRAMLATGCRPSELTYLDAADVTTDLHGEKYWLVHHKNEQHTGQRRRIYLTAEALEITDSLLRKFSSGRLFRSANKGRPDAPLSETYLNHGLRKVCRLPECRALGLDEFQPLQRSSGAPMRLYKYVAYTCRHTFAVRYLTGHYRDEDGQPIILGYPEVAQYMGNSAAMVEKIYGHLVEQTKFLSARLRGKRM